MRKSCREVVPTSDIGLVNSAMQLLGCLLADLKDPKSAAAGWTVKVREAWPACLAQESRGAARGLGCSLGEEGAGTLWARSGAVSLPPPPSRCHPVAVPLACLIAQP